jgi:hypothetical protein
MTQDYSSSVQHICLLALELCDVGAGCRNESDNPAVRQLAVRRMRILTRKLEMAIGMLGAAEQQALNANLVNQSY